MDKENKCVILITGLTGYVATHIAQQLLYSMTSNCTLKATVRDKNNLSKLKNFIAMIGEETFKKIELIEMDLTKPESIINALEGVTHVIHAASPVNSAEFTTYDAYFEPVRIGTTALIEGCKKHHVKKLVVTSTALTVVGEMPKEDGSSYNEDDFVKIGGKIGYTDSKVLEEDLIKEFTSSQSETEAVIILPSFILGPYLISTPSSSI